VIKLSVQVSYKKQVTLGIIGVTILLLAIEIIANVWWATQIHCEFEQNEIFQECLVLNHTLELDWEKKLDSL